MNNRAENVKPKKAIGGVALLASVFGTMFLYHTLNATQGARVLLMMVALVFMFFGIITMFKEDLPDAEQ